LIETGLTTSDHLHIHQTFILLSLFLLSLSLSLLFLISISLSFGPNILIFSFINYSVFFIYICSFNFIPLMLSSTYMFLRLSVFLVSLNVNSFPYLSIFLSLYLVLFMFPSHRVIKVLSGGDLNGSTFLFKFFFLSLLKNARLVTLTISPSNLSKSWTRPDFFLFQIVFFFSRNKLLNISMSSLIYSELRLYWNLKLKQRKTKLNSLIAANLFISIQV